MRRRWRRASSPAHVADNQRAGRRFRLFARILQVAGRLRIEMMLTVKIALVRARGRVRARHNNGEKNAAPRMAKSPHCVKRRNSLKFVHAMRSRHAAACLLNEYRPTKLRF